CLARIRYDEPAATAATQRLLIQTFDRTAPMTDARAPSPSRLRPTKTLRRRTLVDRLLVLALIIAVWQAGSAMVGIYGLSSPWATATRFIAMIASGELINQASYTIGEAVAGTLIAGVPAVLLPFLLRRHPTIVAILDPFMVGGYGAPKLALAPL